MDLSIIIPAYNEVERLPPTLEAVAAYFRAQGIEAEIIVSDDGSTDETVEVLEPSYPQVKFLRAPANQGKGAAVRRGMLAAAGEIVVFSDADLSTPIGELGAMMEAIRRGECDIAIASRGLPDSTLDLRQPWWREISGKIFNRWVRPLTGLPFRDTQCGFKVFARDAARRVFGLARSNGWAFDVEALMIADMLDLRVHEMPVHWINDEGSKVSFFIDGPKMIGDIIRFRYWRFAGLYARAEIAAQTEGSEPDQ